LPCDEDGGFLPDGNPPDPRSNPDHDDWDPFEDEVQFLTADFLYRQEEMSAGNINILFDLWALSMSKHEEFGPFSSYEQMYSAIDNIKHGDVPWKCFSTSYAGELGPNAPSWQLQDYEVWFRDPDFVIQNMLDNPDFDGYFDYAPYIDLDKAGNRRWDEFMSGNFAWRHAVSPSVLYLIFFREK
jgi:Plavaka transposase